MQVLRQLAQSALKRLDAWYFRRHRLRAVGPVLFVGRDRYRGPQVQFEDGTSLEDSQPIGRLHFNNAQIAAIGDGSLNRTGLRFAKLMRESLRQLAECACTDPAFADVRVFQGVTWIPAHGSVVGFVSRPLPKGWRARLLSGHFRLLLWAFAPAARTRATAKARPQVYWLTRESLVQNIGRLKHG